MRFYDPLIREEARRGAEAQWANPKCVRELVEQKFGFRPDWRQAEVICGSWQRLLLCCTRQWGKSTTAAALAGVKGMAEPGALIVCVSPTLRQTKEFIRKTRDMLERAEMVVGRGGQLEFELKNGSRFLGVPGRDANVRGFSAPRLVVVDEAARVEESTYKALRPMLAVGGGALALLSTPFGERGFFWREWTTGGDGWKRVEVKATQCGRIPESFLDEERRSLGEEWFAQEYLCSFGNMENQVFRNEWLERAKSEGLHIPGLAFRMRGGLSIP